MKRSCLLLGTLSLISACDTHPHPLEARFQARAPKEAAVDVPAAAYMGSGQQQSPSALYRRQKDAGSVNAPADQIGRMVTRTAEIRAVVTHPDSTSTALTSAVEAVGGFVEDARQWQASGQTLASLTLRVPDARLASTLDAIKRGAIRVENEAVTGTDVTGEYTDLGAQLRNLRATEAELRSLLVTVGQRTRKAQDVLDVFNQLTEVRGQIEQAEARMGTLSKLAQLATIHVDLVPDALSQPIAQTGWRPLVTVRGAFSTLLGTLRWGVDALIWVIVYLVPIIVAVAIPVGAAVLGVRAVRRKLLTSV
ncbi:MAG TPA: DUF4349 domain-containing protein [Gemmatimonadales bacterium]|nr:DUF4349 domain-containing protein [Gemmatimonadales bacterium]